MFVKEIFHLREHYFYYIRKFSNRLIVIIVEYSIEELSFILCCHLLCVLYPIFTENKSRLHIYLRTRNKIRFLFCFFVFVNFLSILFLSSHKRKRIPGITIACIPTGERASKKIDTNKIIHNRFIFRFV